FEAVEGGAEILPLLQDGDPRKSGLESIQHQLLVERARIVFRHAPLIVVIVAVNLFLDGPAATDRFAQRRRALRLAFFLTAFLVALFFTAFFFAGLRAAALAIGCGCSVASILLPS